MATERWDDERPWGGYRVLRETAAYKVKEIMVAPGCRLSLQRHQRRSENWVFVRGTGVVTRDAEEIDVAPGATVEIPVGTAHRVHNTGPGPLVFVEVQRGDYFGEDDIERISDDYGRAPGQGASR